MTEQEYDDRIFEIKKVYNDALMKLNIEFARSNAQFKIGDILRDHRGTIKVEKIKISVYGKYPVPVYIGPELKKDLTPKKNVNIMSMYGHAGIEVVR